MANKTYGFLLSLLVLLVYSSLVKSDDYEIEESLTSTEYLQGEVRRLKDQVKRLEDENNGLKSSTNEANRKLAYTDRQMRNGSLLRPNDCSDLLMAGETQSGVYLVYPFECSCTVPIYVYCDMVTDGGGWTVILNREQQDHVSRQVNFNRTWTEYKHGFGPVSGEHWLGNDNVYYLTNSKEFTIRQDMVTVSGETKIFKYDSFRIGNERQRYKVTFGTKSVDSTTTYDCYYYNKNKDFSTWDRDLDTTTSYNIAALRGGGWWYSSGYTTHSPTGPFNEYMNISCYRYTYEIYRLTKLQIKIRPSLCDSTYKKITLGGDCNGGGCRSSFRFS